jgi:hypothetical protein
MKINYKQTLFLYFVLIFSAFAVGVILFEQSREREHKTEALKEKLDAYANMVNAALEQHSNSVPALDSLQKVFPANVRTTWIDEQGKVL